MKPIRVLIVDDSAFTRKVLRELLEMAPGVTVVGTARDGLDALEKIAELAPDVVTLDLVMPGLDGVGVLHALRRPDAPRVIAVSSSDADSDLGIAALQSGAVELVHKPTNLASDRLYEIASELGAKVIAAAAARPLTLAQAPAPPLPALPAPTRVGLVVIGTSTGGPQALTHLLPALPRDFPAPIAIALHIPAGYTDALARRLDALSAIRVVEAAEGLALTPGMAAIAPGGQHLTLYRRDTRLLTHVTGEPATSLYRPSVNLLFEAAAQAMGSQVLGVVLTGMGDDGLLGARAICRAGGRIVNEAEPSCIVYGMPRAVQEAGLSCAEAPIGAMAELIARQL